MTRAEAPPKKKKGAAAGEPPPAKVRLRLTPVRLTDCLRQGVRCCCCLQPLHPDTYCFYFFTHNEQRLSPFFRGGMRLQHIYCFRLMTSHRVVDCPSVMVSFLAAGANNNGGLRGGSRVHGVARDGAAAAECAVCRHRGAGRAGAGGHEGRARRPGLPPRPGRRARGQAACPGLEPPVPPAPFASTPICLVPLFCRLMIFSSTLRDVSQLHCMLN